MRNRHLTRPVAEENGWREWVGRDIWLGAVAVGWGWGQWHLGALLLLLYSTLPEPSPEPVSLSSILLQINKTHIYT